MAVLEIKSVRIGEGRTKAIVSLMDADVKGLLQTAERAVAAGADCLEWRADFFAQAREGEALAAACRELMDALPSTPLIFTLRSKGQGGQLEFATDEYVELCRAVVEGGRPDLIDIELGIGDDLVRSLVDFAHEHGVHAIVSHHDFAATPETDWMCDCLLHMAELGADIPKLAVMPATREDPRRLMQATSRAHERLEQPLLTMAMGVSGRHTRLSGEVFGSALTFCALGQASAPGQVELAEALATMEALHRQRA